jgi:hypothetical protein
VALYDEDFYDLVDPPETWPTNDVSPVSPAMLAMIGGALKNDPVLHHRALNMQQAISMAGLSTKGLCARTEALRAQHHGVDFTSGPRGGQFHLSASGQKVYKHNV